MSRFMMYILLTILIIPSVLSHPLNHSTMNSAMNDTMNSTMNSTINNSFVLTSENHNVEQIFINTLKYYKENCNILRHMVVQI